MVHRTFKYRCEEAIIARYDLPPATNKLYTIYLRAEYSEYFTRRADTKIYEACYGLSSGHIVTLYMLIIKLNELPANYRVIGYRLLHT